MKRSLIQVSILVICLTAGLISCNTGNKTDIRDLLSQSSLPCLKNSKLIQVSSADTADRGADRISILAGHTATIFNVEGPGMIVRLWFAVECDAPNYLRNIVIRMYWDDEERPSVEVPFGDFFGCGFRYAPYAAQYLGMTGGGYLCYFPMPFDGHARIDIVNETGRMIPGFTYHIDYQKFEGALFPDVAYFHAQWRRNKNTDNDTNFVILYTEGKGHLVGVNLNIFTPGGDLRVLEGDEMIYVDGEKKPSVHGTGTEAFSSAGAGPGGTPFAGPFNGIIWKDDSLGQVAIYRHFIPDPIPFKKKIKVTIEHGNANKVAADYSSTAYWYQLDPHKDFPRLPDPAHRGPGQ